MYYIERRPGGYECLVETDKRTFAAERAKWEPEGFRFRHVHFTEAHDWVKRGYLHSTDLWRDIDGRIRKAGPGEHD